MQPESLLNRGTPAVSWVTSLVTLPRNPCASALALQSGCLALGVRHGLQSLEYAAGIIDSNGQRTRLTIRCARSRAAGRQQSWPWELTLERIVAPAPRKARR